VIDLREEQNENSYDLMYVNSESVSKKSMKVNGNMKDNVKKEFEDDEEL
jgi:hypothetical protein